jgi:amidophosphoribosyltransferase
VKPLEVGSVGFDIGVVASETCALNVIGAEHTGAVEPGEVVLFTPQNIRREKRRNSPTKICAFEYVYLARLDSQVDGVPVQKVRNAIGKELAGINPVKGDVIVGVPETALSFAAGYSHQAQIPNEPGFARTGRHTRTALKPTQIERLTGVQLKLSPIKYSVDGRDIVLIDDSVVRGNTLRNTVLNLKRNGAKKVHVRIGSPALVSPCPFGVEIPEKDELIGESLSEQEIADVIGADTFAFLPREALARATGLPMHNLCMRCFGQEEN